MATGVETIRCNLRLKAPRTAFEEGLRFDIMNRGKEKGFSGSLPIFCTTKGIR